MTKAKETEYVIKVSGAAMPSSCWGIYRRIAVIEVEKGVSPKMISDRARGVVRIVETWEDLHLGQTRRCAVARAMLDAIALANSLNGDERYSFCEAERHFVADSRVETETRPTYTWPAHYAAGVSC